MAARVAEWLELVVDAEFEESLELQWRVSASAPHADTLELADSTVEMVIDRSDRSNSSDTGPWFPAKDAMVKQVPVGKERHTCVQNMPDGRNFLVAVAGTLRDGGKVRSPWVRASTLSPAQRDKDLGNLDPMSMPRLGCKSCPCVGYVPQRWALNSPDKMRCRRCGCQYTLHKVVEASEIFKAREDRARARMQAGKKVKRLPMEALEWDDRQCSLWFQSEGLFHPTHAQGVSRDDPVKRTREGVSGRVSVITPTTDKRHRFHRQLWECFLAQDWPDKELVVVETFVDQPSDFFTRLAEKDQRLVYMKFKREAGADWSIGLKRNMCAHLATGEFIANFDDDDLYAPSYLSTMVPLLADRKAHVVTLSSWFTFETRNDKWNFCDAIAWGWHQGMDGDATQVKNWALGYGFSYVHRKQDLMEVPYDDINMGEDFSFVSRILARNGDKSVTLFHDEFGICLHQQHGENTSNTFPIREVSREEAADLDVADLPTSVTEPFFTSGSEETPAGRGHRTLIAHTLGGQVDVVVTAGATVSDFLARLEEAMPGAAAGEDGGPVKVFRVPVEPLKAEGNLGSPQWLAELLGFSLDGPWKGEVDEEGKERVRRHKDSIMAQARLAMSVRDRINLRAKRLWVLPASMVQGDEEALPQDDDMMMVEVTVQRADAKSYFSVGNSSIKARLQAGAEVRRLRELMGRDLPPTARVLVNRRGRGLVPLVDSDALPEQVTITEFKGNKNFYMVFSKNQCFGALSMMKNYFKKPETQQKLDVLQKDAKGNEMEFRGKLSMLLVNEVYPPIFRHYGLPEGSTGSRYFMDAMGGLMGHFDKDLILLWLEVETMMRNETNIRTALQALQSLGVNPQDFAPPPRT